MAGISQLSALWAGDAVGDYVSFNMSAELL